MFIHQTAEKKADAPKHNKGSHSRDRQRWLRRHHGGAGGGRGGGGGGGGAGGGAEMRGPDVVRIVDAGVRSISDSGSSQLSKINFEQLRTGL